MNHRNKSVNTHQFAMVPRAEIPRSAFTMQTTHKTTFNAGFLIPIFCEEILPGDTLRCKMTAFARLATPIFPIMDNLYLDTFFFFVPNRLVWTNWVRFMGEQPTGPADSISFLVPIANSLAGGWPVGSIGDYFGLPTVGQYGGVNVLSVNALPLRGYNLIWNQWFRDENMFNWQPVIMTDGPDPNTAYGLLPRGKRHDYFTSALPWPQKGGTSVNIPLLGNAVVKTGIIGPSGTQQPITFNRTDGAVPANNTIGFAASGQLQVTGTATAGAVIGVYPTNLYADLSTATAATINQLRQSFQIQKLLERDARGGTRYTEIVRAHFGVISPDARLDRPEYLGGGSMPMIVNPIAQTSATGVTGSTTPVGTLAAVGTALGNAGFSQSFTEHGYVIGMACVRADLTYQQGVRRMWSRSTRYDFYFPAFAMLGEQAILTKEIFADGNATDNVVFGYQERWAEYRHSPSKVTGLFRSTSTGTLDAWHLAQRFTTAPVLNSTFITETPPLQRILAVGAAANGAQIIFDSFFDMKWARPMPLYSVPGLIDHF